MRDIALPYAVPSGEAIDRAKALLRRGGATVADARIYRRSVDARKKKDIKFVYSVLCTAKGDPARLAGIAAEEKSAVAAPEFGSGQMNGRPLICGFGPAGMFAALTLAENGYAPVVCERGPDPARRLEKIRRFFATGELDPEGNVQFGAGGAGMFSDGKLMTRINDPYCRLVLEKLCELGAPEDILVNARPHVGTDLLCGVVERAAERIRELGGSVHYDTRVTGLRCDSSGAVTAAHTSAGDIPCGAFVLAAGHSARDVYTALLRVGYPLTPRPISAGFRIEHLRRDIDRALYGDAAGDALLGPAEYNLSARVDGMGVYTFCMCPGGEVIAAASDPDGVVTNGASRYARDGVNSNSAVLVSIPSHDPMELQISLERAAFAAGGGGHAAPVQTVGDFLSGSGAAGPGRVKPSYTRGATRIYDLASLLPGRYSAAIAQGIRAFGKKIEGFDSPHAVLTGVETRTTAPYRLERGGEMCVAGHDNFYPCGEGAGWAGGITSAAVDGVRVARAIMKRYKRN